MPRQPHLELLGVPMHVVQGGVNRCAIFLDDEHRHHYFLLLRMDCERSAVRVYVFVLIGNYVYLLVSADNASAVSSAMRLSGQSYVQDFNVRHRRSGTLWQGRFESCLVQTTVCALGLTLHRTQSDTRPLAGIVNRVPPVKRAHASGACAKPTHNAARGLSASWLRCGRAGVCLCKWLHTALAREDENSVRLHLMQERALGDSRFQAMVELALGIPTTYRPTREIQVG